MAKGLIEQESLTNIANAIRSKNGKTVKYTPAEMPEAIMDISGLDGFPIGGIATYGGATVPDGWLLCDGSTVSRELYPDLFEVIGTVFGEGDGSSTFNVPDYRDKFALGAGGDVALAETGGEKEHNHVENVFAYNGRLAVSNTDLAEKTSKSEIYTVNGATGFTPVYGTKKGDAYRTEKSSNMPPYVGIYYIIKAKQNAGVVATVVDNLESTSATDALSANMGKKLNDKITPIVLFEGSSYEEITLSDSVANYSYLDVYTITESNELLPLIRVEKGQTLFRLTYSRYDTGITVQSKMYSISDNKITPTAADRLYVNSANTVAYTSNSLEELSRVIKIIKVVGYK